MLISEEVVLEETVEEEEKVGQELHEGRCTSTKLYFE